MIKKSIIKGERTIEVENRIGEGKIGESIEGSGLTGLLIPPRAPEAIAEAVVRLYRDPALGLRLAEEGRRLVAANYTIDVMLDKTEALYARLRDERKG